MCSGARRQSWIDATHNRYEAVGLPDYSNPLAFDGNMGNPESVATIEASDDDENITPGRVKAKLVTSLKQALLQNVKAMMGNSDDKANADIDDDGTGQDIDAKIATDKGDDEAEQLKAQAASATKEEEGEEGSGDVKPLKENRKPKKTTATIGASLTTPVDDVSENDSIENGKPDLLEENLMKIDKKKLVHLLANLMRKNRDRELDTDASSDVEDAKTLTKAATTSNKTTGDADKIDAKEVAKMAENNIEETLHYSPRLSKSRHQVKAGARHQFEFDPYAQIGSADPQNGQVVHSSRHNLHGNKHLDKDEKEEHSPKEIKEKLKEEEEEEQEEKSEKLEEKVEDKAEDKMEEKEKTEEKLEQAEELAEEKAEHKVEEKNEEKEKKLKEEKTKMDEKNAKLTDEEVKEVKIETLALQKLKNEKMDPKIKYKDGKSKAEEEEAKVEAEVEKERQELKKIKEEEKQEKEKENQLKAQNAVLEHKQSKTKEEDVNEEAELEPDTTNNSKDVDNGKEQMKLKEQQTQESIYHLVSPALVSAIAENLQHNKQFSDLHTTSEDAGLKEDGKDDSAVSSADEQTVSFEDAKLDGTKEADDTTATSEEIAKASQESLNETTDAVEQDDAAVKEAADEEDKNTATEDEKDEALAAAASIASGPNIQTILNHMKEKLNAVKGNKQKNSSSNTKEKGKKRKGFFDDAYAQIGSSDPNVKKRSKTIFNRGKKGHIKKTRTLRKKD